MNIHLRLHIHTELGPVGPRLGRERPFPKPPYHFPDTKEGREQAEQKLEEIREYVAKNKKGKR